VDQLGPNALGEVLEPGRIADCYLGLLLPPGPAGEPEAGTMLIVAHRRRGRAASSQRPPAGWQPALRAAHRPSRAPAQRAGVPGRPHLRAARLALRHLGHPGSRSAGGCSRRGRLLAGRPPGRSAVRRPQLRGGPLPPAARHDLHTQPAPRPTDRSAAPRLSAVAAPHERAPPRRPLPLTSPSGCARVVGGCPKLVLGEWPEAGRGGHQSSTTYRTSTQR
jgi:hypothetical protein